MYTITECAKTIGVSRQSIYNKIETLNLQEYLTQTDKGKVINKEGFEILKNSFDSKVESKLNNKVESDFTKTEQQYLQRINDLKSEIDYLKSIIDRNNSFNENFQKLLIPLTAQSEYINKQLAKNSKNIIVKLIDKFKKPQD